MTMECLDARGLSVERVRDLLADQTRTFWIDIDSNDSAQHALLAEAFHFHPLAIEDTLDLRSRVKIDDYGSYLFLVLRLMRFDSPQALDPNRLGIAKLCLFLGVNYLVSVHAGSSEIVSRTAAKLQRGQGTVLEGSPAGIAHSLSDAIVDGYFPILDEVDDFVDTLEGADLLQVDQRTFEQVLQVRRAAFAAHRSLKPHRDIFDVLAHRESPFVPSDVRLYFRDVYDHALRITDSLEAYRELIGSTTDSYLAQISTRLNFASRSFSAVATIAIPFIIISGLYGMNFPWLPLTRTPGGFWIVLAFQVAISLALFATLRARQMI